jgi:hypothetical protein
VLNEAIAIRCCSCMHACMHACMHTCRGNLAGLGMVGWLAEASRLMYTPYMACEGLDAGLSNVKLRVHSHVTTIFATCACVCTFVFPPGSAAIATRDTMRRPIPLRSRQEPHIKMQLKQCLCNSVCRNACLCICEFVGIGHGPVKGRDGPPRYGRERLRSASEVCRAGIDHVQGLHE